MYTEVTERQTDGLQLKLSVAGIGFDQLEALNRKVHVKN
jgi:hypothetical protein